jgi:hypothetical protein
MDHPPVLSHLHVEPLHIRDRPLLVLRRPGEAITGIEIIPLFPEMGLEVFHGPMFPGDPGKSFRAESSCLGDSLPRAEADRFSLLAGDDLPHGSGQPKVTRRNGLQLSFDE